MRDMIDDSGVVYGVVFSPQPEKIQKRKPINYKKKAIELAKKIVRSQGYCEKCGSTTRQLHGSHVFSVRHDATAADLDNIITLCAYCHVFSKDSWHEEPMENAEWFKKKWPGRFERLLKNSQELCNYTQEDWKLQYEDLQHKWKTLEKLKK